MVRERAYVFDGNSYRRLTDATVRLGTMLASDGYGILN